MPNITHSIKLGLSFILSTLLLVAVILFLRNGSTMIIGMDTPNNTLLSPQIYFANTSEGFSGKRTTKSFKNRNNNYYFNLPKLDTIQQIRLDPHNQKSEINLHQITIVKYEWLKRSVYRLPLEHFKPVHQIENYHKNNKTVVFTTIGNDPQLHIDFNIQKISKTKHFPLYQLLLSMLITSILFYLYHIYIEKILPMPNITHSIKLGLSFILSTLLLVAVILFLRNGSTMIIGMDTPNNTLLSPQIYFANTSEGFSGKRTTKSFKNRNNNYYFNLPKLDTIQQIRLDPHNQKSEINLHQITIVKYEWLKRSVYRLPLEHFKPVHQIENYHKNNKTVVFTTIGNDPQLHIDFNIQKISKTKHFPLYQLLLSMLITSILFYLYHIYRTLKLDDLLSAKLILYALFLLFAFYKVSYYKEHVKFAYPPDELAHLSYIQYVHTHPSEFIPHFKEMVMINNQKAGNYLSHPSMYYELMDVVYDETKSIIHNVQNFRDLNMLLFMASFLLLLYLGFSSSLGILGHFTYLSVITSIPMSAYLGGSITNDNLAVLGGMLFILGLKRALEERYDNLTYFILAMGIFIGYFSKLTVAILIFFALILFFIYTYLLKNSFKISKLQVSMLALFALPVLAYQFYIFDYFHALVPTFNVTHPEEYLKSGFYVPEEYRHYLTNLEWLDRMKRYVIEGWFNMHSHHSLIKSSIIEYSGLFILHILAIIALFFKCKESPKTYCILGKIGLISLILLMVVQYIFSYKAHLSSGYMGGLQPRYLLPFMFSFAIMASIFVERFKSIFLFNIIIILLCIHALYSDFFYFLIHYV